MSNTACANALRKLSLTNIEREVIIGCVLGDGTLSEAGKNYRLRIEHQSSHRAYVDWKYQYLSRLCINAPKYVKQHNSYRFGTIGHPEITQLREEIYEADGKKTVPESIIKKITPLSIAVWFMDDGYKIHHTVGVAVHCFKMEDIVRLQKMLNNMEICTRIQQDGQGLRLYVKTSSYLIFEKLVKPYMVKVPCMAYKLILTP